MVGGGGDPSKTEATKWAHRADLRSDAIGYRVAGCLFVDLDDLSRSDDEIRRATFDSTRLFVWGNENAGSRGRLGRLRTLPVFDEPSSVLAPVVRFLCWGCALQLLRS